MLILCWSIIVLNIVSFLVMGLDKFKAKHQYWRIPEKYLMFLAFMGGAVGIGLGMAIFKHKIRHRKFIYGVPLCGIVNLFFIIKIFVLFV